MQILSILKKTTFMMDFQYFKKVVRGNIGKAVKTLKERHGARGCKLDSVRLYVSQFHNILKNN